MHSTLVAIQNQLTGVISQLQSVLPNDEPFGNAHNNWSFPGLTRKELVAEAQTLVDSIDESGLDDIGDADALLQDYIRRLRHLNSQTIPNLWGNPALGVPSYMFTLQGLRTALAPALRRDEREQATIALRKLTTQLRGMESRLAGLEPRTSSLAGMVERIEGAYNAADQLPSDMESLAEARQSIAQMLKESTKDRGDLGGLLGEVDHKKTELEGIATEAAAVLARCEQAYSASTSVGLAAAFSERSESLSNSMWAWVGGLVAALAAGSHFGTSQLDSLAALFRNPNVAPSVIALNLVLSVFSVAAPVWFAWLATKQIGQRFRLAEDYAFKASISRAYEGYRQEAHRIDKDLEARLLESALARLDELPLRLVESTNHGSPWHEMLSSDVLKDAVRTVPGFAEQVKELANRALAKVGPARQKAADQVDEPK